jgi:tetratricopeptide (TPR) repeat protein
MRKLVAVARRIDVQRRIEVFVKAAEDAMKVDDVIGAANNYRLALQLGEDPYLRTKLEDVDDIARTRRRDLNLKRARGAERAERWSDAAMFFVKAFDARAEAGIAERAAYSIRMSNGDLAQAASLAEKAIAMEPKNPEHWVTSGEIHLAAGSLQEAANSAAKALEIAPKDPRATELTAMIQRAKKKK